MKLSDVFWNAAQLIEDKLTNRSHYREAFCCSAIGSVIFGSFDGRAAYRKYNKARNFFGALFADDEQSSDESWWVYPFISTRDQEARRLALLFAHEIALDEEGR